jgi:butyrate kinase
MRLLIINPGATSTKIAVYEDETEAFQESILHAPEAFSDYAHIIEQLPLREELVRASLSRAGYAIASFNAVCSRGGLLRHIPSGTYAINEAVIHDIEHPPFGEHASSLGPVIAWSIAKEAGIPAYLVDPVSVDEMQPVARVSGLKGMERESFFHALNQKAVARKAAADLGKPYESLNLIVVHMGGGVSVAAHEKGRVRAYGWRCLRRGAREGSRGGCLQRSGRGQFFAGSRGVASRQRGGQPLLFRRGQGGDQAQALV